MSQPWLDPAWRVPSSRRESIVFAHGAIVRGWEMGIMRGRLAELGYHVRQFRYRSMLLGLDENVRRLRAFIAETEGEVVHVVAHSMGGVLTRLAFEQDPDPRPGRLIAIGSPLLDCWIGRRVERLLPSLGRRLVGRTVHDHISRASDPQWHGAREFGIIAGTYPVGIGAIFPSLPTPSDGVVLLGETRVRGIADHVTYRLNHFGMLFSRRCAAQVASFLATGRFGHPTGIRDTP